MPEVSVTIVGRNPGPAVRELGQMPGVTVTGTVDDVRPFLDEAEVYIVPLRIGGGTRLKIFEAFAMKKAVVSTTIGAEGLNLEDGRQIALADNPEAFASAIVAMLRDAPRREALGEQGRRMVEQRHSWDSITRVFESYLMEASDGRVTAQAERRVAVS
jgi:glycosyltransferase involved in cell wall biosynthesis